MINETVHDISPLGLFLEIPAGRAPHPGDGIGLNIFPSGMTQGLVTCGTIAWSGYSPKFGCYGAGIRLTPQLPQNTLSQLVRQYPALG